jgi:predicted nicotinamide N-methyase
MPPGSASPFPSDTLLARYAPVRPVPGCPGLLAAQADDVFALWTAWEAECRRPREVPYWATVWPAAQVLAAWILEHEAEVRGKAVLDVGCGGAVGGIAAARAGAAPVAANDIDRVALFIARRNATANGTALGWSREDLLQAGARLPFQPDVVFVADLFYQKDLAARASRFLATMRAEGARVVIADGGRPFVPRDGVRPLARVRVPVSRSLEGVDEREVAILEFE